MWIVPFQWVDNGDEAEVSGIAIGLAPPSNSSGSGCEGIRFRRVGYFGSRIRKAERDADLVHPLWNPLTRAMKNGDWPLVDITIV
ncbi:hypothetical protein VTO73DRAFT_7775 [Trametes versicolor]